MTAAALIKRADLKRMAEVANETGATVWVEIDGKKIGITPASLAKSEKDRLANRPLIQLL